MGDVTNINKNKVETPQQILYCELVEVINNHVEDVNDCDVFGVLAQLSVQAMERIADEEDY